MTIKNKYLEAKEKMAYEILELLKKYNLNTDVHIYFNNKCLTGKGEIIENIRGSDYFDYANDDTLSMTFEGAFYEVINYYASKMASIVMPKFMKILDSYGLYYEKGDAWNLTTYYSDPALSENKPIPKEGGNSKNPICIRRDTCPSELEHIRVEWENRQNNYGDVGSCVIGAGFKFKYNGLYYRMPPQGRWQGSCSWEASKNDIQDMLANAGCEDIVYNWGVMD